VTIVWRVDPSTPLSPVAGGGRGAPPPERRTNVISDRDRRTLADIERGMRAEDPALCDRLRKFGPAAGAESPLLPRATSTATVVCCVLALAGTLVLEMALASVLLFATVVTVATVRVWPS
jgi:hypothetical protein